MNGFSHQYLHAKKLEGKGVPFKPIFGVEAYFVPSLEDWKELHRSQLAENAAAKAAKAASKKKKGAAIEEIGNELASTEAELEEIAEAKGGGETEDDSGGTIVENEEESKQKARNPLYQRNHLVLLAKNDDGLKALFKMVSDSAADGFYRYPRMDLEMIRKYAKGNVVGLTACVAGYLAKIVFDHQEEGDFKLWEPNNNNFELIQRDLAQAIREFQDALGPENYYLELQFNKLGAQHLVNYHLIEASKRTGAPLVVTCDAHYSDPNHWREREIYKMMGRLQFMKPEDQRDELPASVDELKCELYPKNAEQIWTSYKHYTEQANAIGETMVCNVDGKPVYDDDLIREAIERTHDIAHQQIGKIEPDRRVKLPAIQRLLSDENIEEFKSKLPAEEADNEDSIAFQAVKQYAIEGLKNRKVAGKQAYIDRLKYELEVIKTLKFAKYFLTYYHIMRVCGEHMTLGNARGSAGGSLLAYVLGITQMDPIKHGLLFERFMTRKKRSFPDIDCLSSNIKVVRADGTKAVLGDLSAGDKVLDHHNTPRKVLAVQHRTSTADDRLWCVVVNTSGTYGSFIANHKHRVFLEDGSVAAVGSLEIGAQLHSVGGSSTVVALVLLDTQVQLTDITVEGLSSFQIVPFNVMVRSNENHCKTIIGVNTYSIDSDEYTDQSPSNRFEIEL